MIQIETIDHVQILAPTGSEAEIRRFYGDLLGLDEVEKPPELRPRGGVWYQRRGRAAPYRRRAGPARSGAPAFRFPRGRCGRRAGALEAAGVRTGEAPPVAGMPRFYA